MIRKLTSEQLTELKNMVNQRLSYIAGPNLSSDLSSDYVIIVTDTSFYGLQGDVHQDLLEGFPELYSSIETCAVDNDDLKEAKVNGNQYYFKQGEIISKVLLVTDTIRGFNDSKEAWEYISDVGIVLKLESGYMAITRLGYHDEMLQVTYMEDMKADNLPATSGRFEDDLHSSHTITRSLTEI